MTEKTGTNSPSKGIKSFLSSKEKKDLIQFIASTGENYDRYLEYCSQRGWKPFTKAYLHTWCQRKRAQIQAARSDHKEEVRKMSMYDKERRIADLERLADQLKVAINKSLDDPRMLISLSDQLGKTFERIAKERGEWLKGEGEHKPSEDIRDRLKAGLVDFLSSAKEAKIIEAAPSANTVVVEAS